MQTSWNVTSKLVLSYSAAEWSGRLRARLLERWPIRHFHISHNTPYLSLEIFRNLCFLFLLGITAIPREIENNAYAKSGGSWGGGDKLGTLGECGSGLYSKWSHYDLGQSCILGEHFSKHRATTPPTPTGSSGVVSKRTPHFLGVCGKQRWTGGKGSSLCKAADLEIVLLCEVAHVNEKKKISSCSVRDCSYSNTWGCTCCCSILSLV